MSSFYQRFRQEMAAGGAVDETVNPQASRSGKITGLLMIGLLVYLGTRNPWTLVFVVGLLISVFLHEVGHFSTARLTGMKATQFFMGFGPRVFSFTRGETEYGVRALPLGAFVRIIGMNNLDEVEPDDEPRAYRSQSYPRRLLVITAGSLMHMLIAFTLFFGVYTMSGREQNTGQSIIHGLDAQGGPAAQAGLQQGDALVSISGVPVSNYDSVVAAIKSHKVGDTISVAYKRDDVARTASVVLGAHPVDAARPYLGIYADDWGWEKLSIPTAATQSVADMGRTLVDSVKGVVTALNPVNSVKHLTNSTEDITTRPTTVVGVSQVGGTIGESSGLKGILILLASINVFVGVFNMFPLLPFDGGHAAIATYERIRSRKGMKYKADIEKMVPVATAVVGLLVLLMVTGLYLDITQPLG
jgi:membrane-associated protease RseP (regulator of RpoE activity)